MTAIGLYQEFEPLTAEEFAALERSILERGVEVPIILDEDGNPLDGHHRLAICQKHGITDYPTIVKAGLSEDEKRNLAQSLNMARRSLSREQKQVQVRNRLKRNPEQSDRLIAQELGVDHKTVGRVRGQLESAGEVPRLERKVGLNGMPYKPPAKPKVFDAGGGEVPQRLESIFNCRSTHSSLANTIADVKKRAGELANRSPLYLQLEKLRHHLTTAENILQQTSPHAIHRSCEGQGCDGCGGQGFLTAGEFPRQVDPVGRGGKQ